MHRPDHLEVIAHRGAPRQFPENSLPGFRRALELGADGIELDVHLTVDGVAVVHHDAALRALPSESPGSGPHIRDLTYEALASRPLAPGVPVPSLSEVLAAVGQRAVVYVEIKALEAVREVVRCIQASGARCAVHGFDHRVALHTAALAPDLPTGILVDSYLIDPAGALRAARARDYWPHWSLIDAHLVTRIHAVSGRVIAWTVNDRAAARALQSIGVDAVCTDVCGVLLGSTRGQRGERRE
jgi:glycerophosphoryl diester phosphodiesterase